MKTKRLLFIGSLIALFGICFTVMNQHYDELSRYPYVTSENRDIILEHLNSEDINYMVSQQLKPEQFLPFIETAGFEIRNTLWYARAKEFQDASNDVIVRFINDFKGRMEYSSLETLLQAYSYDALRTFYESDNEYVKNATLVLNPLSRYTRIQENETLFTYTPKDLISIETIPHVSLVEGNKDILIKAEVVEPLEQLCSAIESVNGKTCGDLILTAGFIAYEDQIPLFESMMLKYGQDHFRNFWDYPGQSEYQLGYTVRFQPAGREDSRIDDNQIYDKEEGSDEATKDSDEKELAVWLEENAHKYGFIIRYPKGKEKLTGKEYQPYTLRYVGIESAKAIHDKAIALEEYNAQAK